MPLLPPPATACSALLTGPPEQLTPRVEHTAGMQAWHGPEPCRPHLQSGAAAPSPTNLVGSSRWAARLSRTPSCQLLCLQPPARVADQRQQSGQDVSWRSRSTRWEVSAPFHQTALRRRSLGGGRHRQRRSAPPTAHLSFQQHPQPLWDGQQGWGGAGSPKRSPLEGRCRRRQQAAGQRRPWLQGDPQTSYWGCYRPEGCNGGAAAWRATEQQALTAARFQRRAAAAQSAPQAFRQLAELHLFTAASIHSGRTTDLCPS